jgi:transketolase
VVEVDGHDVEAIDAALRESAAARDRPSIVLARTHKGRGIRAVEDRNGFHGKTLADPDGAILELGAVSAMPSALRSSMASRNPGSAHLAVRELPMSGRPRELLAWAGIDAAAIAAAADLA